jgi:hypothetical protein
MILLPNIHGMLALRDNLCQNAKRGPMTPRHLALCAHISRPSDERLILDHLEH